MTNDDHLTDLLAERASQGSRVRPTMDGVQDAIARRARRRHRQRLVGTGLAALCVAAGIAGGFALAGGDDTEAPATADLTEVPLVGVDQPGLELVETHVGPLGAGADPPLSYTSFASSVEPGGPVMTVMVDPAGDVPPPAGRAVDLDGDGHAAGEGDGFVTVGTAGGAVGLLWPLPDGRVAGFGAFELSEAFLVDYVQGLDREAFDVAALPNPDGLDQRRTSTLPSPVATQALSAYTGDGGTLQVLTTNDPGWFDFTRMTIDANITGNLTETPLGQSFLGPGVAESTPAGEGSAFAVVRTESGLTIEIWTEGIGVDVVNQILAEGRFVEVEPTEAPTTTTTVEAVTTTTEVPTTSVADAGSTLITDITIEPGDELDRLELFFAGTVPEDYELTPAEEAVDVDCHGPVTDGGDYLVLRLGAPAGSGLDDWDGVLQITPDPNGALQGVLSCCWSDGDAYISLDLDQVREAEIYQGIGQPVLIIDILHPLDR